ncbi:GDP-mannose 4,6-dehydratase, partial [Desulfobacter sp.]|uniref:GDP-mannose 4,6-dehydratase n=1 Tax=Desulfobacter sp. TaxID=2294 RepID=UPI003D1100DA
LMLQQKKPEDFVIATGIQHSVRNFVEASADHLGLKLRWEGLGINETGIVAATDNKIGPKPGDTIVRVDPRYFRPTEVETLLGDPTKARERLGWKPATSFKQLVQEMVNMDLDLAKRDDLCRHKGFQIFEHHE